MSRSRLVAPKALSSGRTIHAPGQPAALRSTGAAEPALEPFGPTMTREHLVADLAMGAPAPRGHVGSTAPLRPGTDIRAFRLPDGVMAMPGTDQGVSDLVQDGIDDLLGAIAVHRHRLSGGNDDRSRHGRGSIVVAVGECGDDCLQGRADGNRRLERTSTERNRGETCLKQRTLTPEDDSFWGFALFVHCPQTRPTGYTGWCPGGTFGVGLIRCSARIRKDEFPICSEHSAITTQPSSGPCRFERMCEPTGR